MATTIIANQNGIYHYIQQSEYTEKNWIFKI